MLTLKPLPDWQTKVASYSVYWSIMSMGLFLVYHLKNPDWYQELSMYWNDNTQLQIRWFPAVYNCRLAWHRLLSTALKTALYLFVNIQWHSTVIITSRYLRKKCPHFEDYSKDTVHFKVTFIMLKHMVCKLDEDALQVFNHMEILYMQFG